MNCTECFHNPVCSLWREHECQDASCYTDPIGDKGGCTLFVKADSLAQVVTCKECVHCANDYLDTGLGTMPCFTCELTELYGENIHPDHYCSYGERDGDNAQKD